MRWILAGLWLGLPALAADYHLSNAGNDLAAGDGPHPWATLARAAQALRPGDTLYLRGGDDFAGPLKIVGGKASVAATLTVTSEGESPAHIQVSTGSAIQMTNLGYIVISKLNVVGGGKGGDAGSGIEIRCDRPAGCRLGSVTVEDVEATGFSNAGILVSVATTKGNSGSGYDGVTIRHCVAWGNRRYGILVVGDLREPADGTERCNFREVHVLDCVVHDNPGDPNFLENHSGDGILIGSVEGGSIERCIAYRNGASCNCLIGGPVGIWAYASRRVTIRDCASFQNRTGTGTDGGGFDLDGGCEDCLIEHCYSGDNDGGGYLLFNFNGAPFRWKNNVLRFCVSTNDGRRGEFGGVVLGGEIEGADVYLNTILLNETTTQGRPACVRFSNLDGRSRQLRFENNVLVSTTQDPIIARVSPPSAIFIGNLDWDSTGLRQGTAAR